MRLTYINGRLQPAQLVKTVRDMDGDTVEVTLNAYWMTRLGLHIGNISTVDVVDLGKGARHVYRGTGRSLNKAGQTEYAATGETSYQYSRSEMKVTCINEINL